MDAFMAGYGITFYPEKDNRAAVADRLRVLCQNIFKPRGSKPFWVTEWGIPVGEGRQADDRDTQRMVAVDREALGVLAREGQLGALMWYSFNGMPKVSDSSDSVDSLRLWRNGSLSETGKEALRPLNPR